MTNTLLGGAISDALGVPFEGKLANDPLLLGWDQKSFLGSEHHKLLPGQFSDDGQMQQMVAKSLIDNVGFNPDDLAFSYVDWMTSGRARGFGRTTKIAIDRLILGVHWSKSGVEGSYGNGTAMRAAPFGIYFRDDLPSLIDACSIDAQITHASDEAIAGSIAIALAVAHTANNDTNDLIKKIVPLLPNSKVKSNIFSLSALLDNKKITPEIALRVLGTKADVRETTASALYCFMKFSSFQEAVITAINAGGDTDTTASIVGALFGAKDGVKNIPSIWVEQVEDRDKLLVLDSQLYNRSNASFLQGIR